MLVGLSSIAQADLRPNILFICTDDQAPWAAGFAGNKDAQTPNLDRLRSEGAWLTNSFTVTPVCSPSRAALMSSRYSSELGIYDWIKPDERHGLDPQLPTWPRLLQQAGYQTGLIGKWHCGHTPANHPTKHGYEYFMGLLMGGCATRGPMLEKDGQSQKFEGLAEDIFTEHALQFIERHKAGRFALSLHFRAPHTAYLPVADEDAAHFTSKALTLPEYPGLDVKKTETNMRAYLSSMACVDRNVGRLMRQLDELQLRQNTVVIYTSDHGYNIGQHGIWHKGNAGWMLKQDPPKEWPNIPAKTRPNMFDTSLKLPTLVRWPGVVKPDSTIDRTVTNIDWFPTLCAITGTKLPSDAVIRGRDISPALRAQPLSGSDDYYGEYNMRVGAKTAMRAYRTREWKLMLDFANPGRGELYDLVADPGETVNLFGSDSPPAKQARAALEAKIRAKMELLGDSEEKATR